MNYKLEVIGFTIESCLIAQAAGVHRIELCDNIADGGTTPSYGFIKSARKKISIELFPIIRPRGGDFLYSTKEFDIMKEDIRLCKNAGCDGIVLGILNADGSIDKNRCTQLTELAYPLGVTFHRAFDRTADPYKAIDDIIETGCERILTSGLQPAAMDGIETIKKLVSYAAKRIIIMPGSGVRSGNILELAKKTGATEFHSSAKKYIESKMIFVNEALKENATIVSTDADEIDAMLKQLRHF